jgi:hypothetical protein
MVPSSALWLSESMTHLEYDLDYATADSYPFVLVQMALRNFAPFEQFHTVRVAKRLFSSVFLAFEIAIASRVAITSGDLLGVVAPAQGLLTTLLQPILAFLDTLLPGLASLIPPVTMPSLTLSVLGIRPEARFIPGYTHTEDSQEAVSYSLTAPPLTEVMGRAVAHSGRATVPFTMDLTRYVRCLAEFYDVVVDLSCCVVAHRSVHVPPGVYGQTTGQVIHYDCK